MPLQGIEYVDDNGKVFDYLKSWTLNGPAWTWRHYSAIAAAKYHGLCKKFLFEMYVTIHQEA
jgi:hypothetical protein